MTDPDQWWEYSRESSIHFEHWWFLMNGRRRLCVVRRDKDWTVTGPDIGDPVYGEIPYGTPPEELQPLAIAMWRLSQ